MNGGQGTVYVRSNVHHVRVFLNISTDMHFFIYIDMTQSVLWYCLVSRLNRLCRFSDERGSNEEVVGGPARFAKEFRGRYFGCDIFAEFLLFQVIKIRESLEEQWEKTRRCFGGGDGRWSCNFG